MIDPTKNKTPFGLLVPEDQEALKVWPYGLQRYCLDGVWRDDKPYFWANSVTYRAKPAPGVEKRTLYGEPSFPGCVYTPGRCAADTHSLTFDVVDGEPVPGSEKWESLDG